MDESFSQFTIDILFLPAYDGRASGVYSSCVSSPGVAMSAAPCLIDDFCRALSALPESRFGPSHVLDFLRAHPIASASLSPYLFFSRGHYTRNLIFKCDLFEVLALCWEVGQASNIHNHRGQLCWMAVPIGKLKNQNFRLLESDEAKRTCKLEKSESCLITPDSPLEVDRSEPIHQVTNLPEFNERAVSIHIYSRPFDSCRIYDAVRGAFQDIPLHYSSEYGVLSPEEKLV